MAFSPGLSHFPDLSGFYHEMNCENKLKEAAQLFWTASFKIEALLKNTRVYLSLLIPPQTGGSWHFSRHIVAVLGNLSLRIVQAANVCT